MRLKALFDEIVLALRQSGVFFGHGAGCAEEEALWLLAHVCNQAPEALNEQSRRHMTPAQTEQARTLLRQRIERRIPMAYVTGQAYFAGLALLSDERALVPRSPFAELVRNRFHPWLGRKEPERMLDLCTGGGCIAIAMATYFPGVHIDAVDLCRDALSLAAENRRRHNLDEQVRLIHSDLFQHVFESYDVIVSNPPYVGESEYRHLPAEYHQEPGMGLVSPGDGLLIPLRIMQQAADYLRPEGLLFLEVGHSGEMLQEALPDVPLTWLLFEHGGTGVCVLSRKELLNYRPSVERALKRLDEDST